MPTLPNRYSLLLVPLALWAASAQADVVLVSRYSGIAALPTSAQQAPLAEIVSLTLPRRVDTVGAALAHLLAPSGYRSVPPLDPASRHLLSLPLPDVHRQIGPLPLARALTTLVGTAYTVQVNPVRREVQVVRRTVQPLPLAVTVPGPTMTATAPDTHGVLRHGRH